MVEFAAFLVICVILIPILDKIGGVLITAATDKLLEKDPKDNK